jgi:hypothetical protein
MSRALRKLAERCGKSISVEAYCERFEKFFLPNCYGALTTSALFEVGRELGLCSRLDTFVSPERAKKQVEKASGLFLVTERYCIGERCVPIPDYMHARLVLNYRKEQWIVWEEEMGRVGRETPVRDVDLSGQMPHFIAFDTVD